MSQKKKRFNASHKPWNAVKIFSMASSSALILFSQLNNITVDLFFLKTKATKELSNQGVELLSKLFLSSGQRV